MINVKATGKLVIAGEWSVLESGNPAIVASVDRFLSVNLTPRIDQKIVLRLPDFQLEIYAEIKNHTLLISNELSTTSKEQIKFIKSAIEVASKYLDINSGFELTTSSADTNFDTPGSLTKIGFGSSAGITVATISALCQLYPPQSSQDISEVIFKLAIISHFLAQEKLGSGLDIASATYGGIILYRSFDAKWLISQIESKTLRELLECPWPNCQIEKLNLPKDLIILAGFTGHSASSSKLISAMNEFKNDSQVKSIYQAIATNTEDLVINWKNDFIEKILIGINNNHLLLKQLAETTNLPLFTKELELLITTANRHGYAAKFSGAGGGDCGLAFGSNPEQANSIRKSWNNQGIIPLSIHFACPSDVTGNSFTKMLK